MRGRGVRGVGGGWWVGWGGGGERVNACDEVDPDDGTASETVSAC